MNKALKHNTAYVVVRKDLPLPQQLVQVAHAAMEMGFNFNGKPHGEPVHIKLHSVEDTAGLKWIAERLTQEGMPFEMFWEPDDNMGFTALCTLPCKTRINCINKLPLYR